MHLPDNLRERYEDIKFDIKNRLDEFASIPASEYFYEFCFCICTPQSRARNALIVVEKLKALDFRNRPFVPSDILFDREHYIRFHNTKALRLNDAAAYFHEIEAILASPGAPFEKRREIVRRVKGYGLKEASHFLRNIGYRNLAILDRHILKHLQGCGVIEEIPASLNTNAYLDIERKFMDFSDFCEIPMDELDLLFWAYQTGEILK